MLALPWLVAPRDLAAGDVIVLGREVDGTTRPPTSRDITHEIGVDVPAGTILGVGDDGRLHPLPAEPDQATATPGRKPRVSAQPAARRGATLARPARRPGNG